MTFLILNLSSVFAFSILGAITPQLTAANTVQVSIIVIGDILGACITSIVLFKITQLKVNQVQLKEHINSRMDQLLKLTADLARAEGVIQGSTKEKADAALVAKGVVKETEKQTTKES